ncbi:hypothetical protein [Streptomyces winkii]|uniref:hypothetical protein n=1 Tax=Streptomyces winkii TaxID=3051178 RepID=UPI0028D20989|nr:hypothetical protein [Streptomyces sp. DSM 40971]
MRWLALETGDAATWGSTVVTFGMACYAIVQGIGQRRDLRRQNELQSEASQLQRRQIETAERRALIMEQLLTQVTASVHPGVPVPPQQPWSAPPAQPPVSPPPARTAPDEPAADADEDVEEGGAGAPAAAAEPAEPPSRPAEPPSRPAPAGPPGSGQSAYGYPQQPQRPPKRRPRGRPKPQQPSQPQAPPPFQQPGPVPAGAPSAPGYGYPQEPAPAWSPTAGAPPQTAGQPWQPTAQGPGPWRLERIGRHGFALRNTGTETLTGVRVSRVNLPASSRGVPEDTVVRPGETTEFLMAGERGQPVPPTVLVSWHGHHGEANVPVPQSPTS